ncbi:MAG: response regulator [Flavobacteriales bacterium]|nr:response regulator [Flavobacteriales bacterium]
MNILICEDERIIAAYLQSLCEDLGYRVCSVCSTVNDAIEALKTYQPDLALLDMNMDVPDAGIQIAKYINNHLNIPFIFITAFNDDETVIKAFEVKPHAYLVKPINQQTLSVNLKLACLKHQNHEKIPPKIMELHNGSEFVSIEVSNVVYIESEGNYCLFNFKSNKRELIRSSLHDIQSLLPPQFIRIHKSYIINTFHLESYTSTKVIINEITIPVGRVYKQKLYDFLEKKPRLLS